MMPKLTHTLFVYLYLSARPQGLFMHGGGVSIIATNALRAHALAEVNLVDGEERLMITDAGKRILAENKG